MIEKGTSDLSSFVKETLDHLTTSEDKVPVNASEIINKYVESINQLLKKRLINLNLNIQQEGNFNTNAIEFRSIISNLGGNAIKYSDPFKSGKFINLSLSSHSNSVVLKVEANGLGIKKENLARLMEQNYQVDKKNSEGVGLGLYMVGKSVHKLGGSINIQSEFMKGTTFIINIPTN